VFVSIAENIKKERALRRDGRKSLRPLGIGFLDDALIGISKSDLVLIGAPSGIGKTQICCTIALSNIAAGKRVHFIALEAEKFEIERRLKYQVIAERFFSDQNRPNLGQHLTFDKWMLGDFDAALEKYESQAEEFMSRGYGDFFVYYKESKFTVNTLVENVVKEAKKSDLFIIDHAHYFDIEENENENRALKTLTSTIRSLVLEEEIPVVLVAHLRKRDKHNDELVPGLDEFHGSSDLGKIATKVVTIAPGGRTEDGRFETFFRIPKNRLNGGSNRFIARIMFDPKRGAYETKYKVGQANLTRKSGFEELAPHLLPEWARR